VPDDDFPFHLFNFAASAAGVPPAERPLYPQPPDPGYHAQGYASVDVIMSATVAALSCLTWWRIRGRGPIAARTITSRPS
jgi:hypothetical protein